MDAVLHGERQEHGRKRLHPLPGSAQELPDGAVIAAGGEAFTIARGRVFRWMAQGYEAPREIARADGVLTPPSTLGALYAGCIGRCCIRMLWPLPEH